MNGWLHDNKYFIYKITNNTTLLSYVGCTRFDVWKRWKAHLWQSKKYPTRPICKAISQYGESGFSVSIMQSGRAKPHSQHPFDMERYWINKLNTRYPNGYNSNKLHKSH